jgi:hypothetical protein
MRVLLENPVGREGGRQVQHSFTELKGAHKGQDIWIIAAGSSMDYVDPSFFEGKITIGVNEVFCKYVCNYNIRKEPLQEEVMAEFFTSHPECKLVISKHIYGHMELPENDASYDHWVFEHGWLGGAVGGMGGLKLGALDMDELIVSGSTITSAIHLAYYMGAGNIILCGHDCGSLDGRNIIKEYPDGERDGEWLGKIEQDTMELRDALKSRNVNIYSLNPFINIGLEGHSYSKV